MYAPITLVLYTPHIYGYYMNQNHRELVDPYIVKNQMSLLLLNISQSGLRKTLSITSTSPKEFYRLLKIAIRLKIDWSMIDPHGGRFSLKMTRESRFRTQ
jgi:hypothetical protein